MRVDHLCQNLAVRIPKFWAAVEGSDDGESGRFRYRRVWGWSMSSAADALAVAQERLRAVLAELRSGTKVGGYYPRVPLREPILDELLVDGEQALVVTRNRYGAEVLNTDRILIADIDIPELDGPPAGGGFLRRLLRRPAAETAPAAEPPVVVERLGTLADWAAVNPGFGVIVYRTASGLRVFVTGVSEPATSPTGGRILIELGADPIYRELCRTHGTFRARLTPKPWRIPRMMAPQGRWPYPEGAAERSFQGWLAAYSAAIVNYAVCRRLAAHGPAPSALEQHIIRLHDERTRVTAELPLA
jgi:hypothetical protein